MENTLNKYTKLEEKITLSMDLLEVARGYCEYNFDKGQEVVALHSVIELLLETHRDIAEEFDKIA